MNKTIQFIGVSPEDFKQDFMLDVKHLVSDAIDSFRLSSKEEYLTRKEVADLVGGGVSLGTVKNWAKKGILTEYGIGRLVRYKRSEVEQAFVQLNS